MPAEPKTQITQAFVCENIPYIMEPERFVPVAIPENLDQSQSLKSDLEAYHIPVHLELREAEMDASTLGGIPVLVPEGTLEDSSELVGIAEMNALNSHDDDFDEFDDLDDEDEDEDFDDLEDEEYDEDEDEDDEDEDDEDEIDDEDLDFDDDLDEDDEEFDDLDDEE